EVRQLARPAAGDHGEAEAELQQQVPPDDPREQLAERGEGVGVGRAGRRHRGRELGVAEGGERRDDRADDERQRDRGPGVLPRLDPGEGEDAGSDDDPDPETDEVAAGQRPPQLGVLAPFQYVLDGHRAQHRHPGNGSPAGPFPPGTRPVTGTPSVARKLHQVTETLPPRTVDLPAQWNPGEVEGVLYERWVERGYFEADNTSDRPPFCIVIPPPNVTGSLHLGHAMDHTLIDILT